MDHAEDAWGSDLDSEQTSAQTSVPRKNLEVAPRGTRKTQALPAPTPWESGEAASQPRSLRSTCLGFIGLHLEDLIDSGGETVLPCLPSDARLSLLAVARRKGQVDESTLPMFLDEAWPVLDIANTGLDGKAIEDVADKLPNLQSLDLSDCILGKRTLQVLGRTCPLVEIIRLRNVNLTVNQCISSMGSVIPCVQESGRESWEDEVDDSACGRWMNLKYIVWPGIPSEVESFLYSVAPKVVVVGTMGAQANRDLIQAANPGISLDQPYVELVGPQAWDGEDDKSDLESLSVDLTRNKESQHSLTPPIAERFRLAYVELDARKAAKTERNCKQRRRRELRKSKAQQVLAHWLDEH